MSLKQIASLARKLAAFLARFADCFGRKDARQLLPVVVQGQLSDLPRKNAETIALHAGKPPRTVQRFYESIKWDEQKALDRCQQIVAQDHAHPEAIGLIDECGNPKSGHHTAGVGRQWCGRTGKVDNCVVAVHLGYAAPNFHCLLDSELYLPEDWIEDAQRRKEHHVPDDVEFHTKQEIALQLLDRALANGVTVSAWTCDEAYGRDGKFFDGMEERHQKLVAEVPSNFTGWLKKPQIPPVSSDSSASSESTSRKPPCRPTHTVQNLARYSRVFQTQSWQRYRVKDTNKGPAVWEIKWSVFYRSGPDGLPTRRHCLIVARNVLTREKKYFVANRAPGDHGVSLRWLLRVAFGRAVVEQCFREAKQELGMGDFQMRGWRCIHRHFILTQLSYLFCAKIRYEYGESSEFGRLTIDQVRRVIHVWLSCLDLPRSARVRRVAAELARQEYYQCRAATAEASHIRTRLALLLSIGINACRIRSCIPPPPT